MKGEGFGWFWSILTGKTGGFTEQTGFGRFRLKQMVLVDFDWKNWGLTKKTGFGRFWRKQLVVADFNWKNWVLVDFGREKLVLNRNKWFWSILAEQVVVVDFDWKTGFWLKTRVLVDFDRKSGFLLSVAKTPSFGRFWPKRRNWADLGLISWNYLLVPPGCEPGASGPRVERLAPRLSPISEVKPGQAHLLLVWATT